jgi:hypothetical protein
MPAAAAKSSSETWPEAEKITRPVPEYLAALDEAAVAEAAESEDSDNDMGLRQLARGTESDVSDRSGKGLDQ